MSTPTTESPAKGSGKPPKQRLSSVTIKIAERGFIGRCSYEPVMDANSKGDACCTQWIPDKEYAFSSREEVDKFLDETLGKPSGRKSLFASR